MLNFPDSRRVSEACLSDLELDRLRVGELEGSAQRDAEAHLGACEACRTRRDVLAADAADFAALPLSLASPPATRRRARAVAVLATLAAAAAVLLVVIRPGDRQTDGGVVSPQGGLDEPSPATRTKGGARLGVFVRRNGRTFAGAPGDRVHPGDALQFHYTAHAPVHAAVLSVDGSGAISVYHPAGLVTAPMAAGEDQAFESSVILDDTLGEETIFGVFCAGRQRIDDLRLALEADPLAPRFPAGCTVDRLVLEKRAEAD